MGMEDRVQSQKTVCAVLWEAGGSTEEGTDLIRAWVYGTWKQWKTQLGGWEDNQVRPVFMETN